jgi:quercetin dioxygenase-like cupin family protein
MRTRMFFMLWAAAMSNGNAGDDVSGGNLPQTQVRVVASHTLPKLDGAHLRVDMVEVTYPPGGRSPVHSHPCAVSGYVIEGAVRMQTKGGPAAVYQAGEAFYEAPDSVHLVSANASAKNPARFLAYFVCDRETELSVPVPETGDR